MIRYEPVVIVHDGVTESDMTPLVYGAYVSHADHEQDKYESILLATAALQSRLEAAEKVVELVKVAKDASGAARLAETEFLSQPGISHTLRDEMRRKLVIKRDAFIALFGALP